MKQDYRTQFLIEFTRHLILNTKTNYPISQHPTIKAQEQKLIPKQIVQEIMFESRPQARTIMIPQIQIPQAQQPRLQEIATKVPSAETKELEIIMPTPQPLPAGFSLMKLDPIVRDKTITMIECPGPNKQVLVKSFMGRVVPTQIVLNEEDIRKIIDAFSKNAKIPIMEGMFKAAVGNLVISAVLSEYVGSRFVINKYTPYSIIER